MSSAATIEDAAAEIPLVDGDANTENLLFILQNENSPLKKLTDTVKPLTPDKAGFCWGAHAAPDEPADTTILQLYPFIGE